MMDVHLRLLASWYRSAQSALTALYVSSSAGGPAELHGAQAQFGDLKAGAAQFAILHVRVSPGASWWDAASVYHGAAGRKRHESRNGTAVRCC